MLSDTTIMENFKISKYPFLVKVALFYLFVKIVDGFFNTLGTVIFQNASPLLKNYLASSITNLSWFYQWMTTTELKVTPVGAIFFIITFYLVYKVSNKFT